MKIFLVNGSNFGSRRPCRKHLLKIAAKAGTTGKIFGSVTNVQISQALKEQFEIDVDRKKVILPDEVKTVSTYTGTLNLHPEVQAELAFEVVQE